MAAYDTRRMSEPGTRRPRSGRFERSRGAQPPAAAEQPRRGVGAPRVHRVEDGRTLHGVAVRTERWRYAEFGPSGVNGAMLFDEAADPLELTNLADDPKLADVRRELSALVRQYSADAPSRTP